MFLKYVAEEVKKRLKNYRLARKSGQKPTFKTKVGSRKPLICKGLLAFSPLAHFFSIFNGIEKLKLYIDRLKKVGKWADGYF